MILDLLFIAITILFVFFGLKKGFVKESLSLFKLLLIIYLIPKVLSIELSFLEINIDNSITKYAMYIITFIIVYVVISILSMILSKFIDSTPLTFFNKILGGVFGFVKSSIVIFIIFIVSLVISDRNQDVKNILENSIVTEYVSIYLEPYNTLFPDFIKTKLDNFTIYSKEKQFKNKLIKDIQKGISYD